MVSWSQTYLCLIISSKETSFLGEEIFSSISCGRFKSNLFLSYLQLKASILKCLWIKLNWSKDSIRGFVNKKITQPSYSFTLGATLQNQCPLIIDNNVLHLSYTHLWTSLSETEDVVDKKQHILSFLITEVLSYSQASQCYSGTGTRRLVHLTIHQSYLITHHNSHTFTKFAIFNNHHCSAIHQIHPCLNCWWQCDLWGLRWLSQWLQFDFRLQVNTSLYS